MSVRLPVAAGVWLFVGMVSPFGLLAIEPPEKAKHLSIRSTKFLSTPYATDKGGGTDVRTCGARLEVVEEVEGQLVARTADINHECIGLARTPPRAMSIVQYREMRKDDLVPVFRNVYRVTRLTKGPGGPHEDGHQVELEWVPDDKLPPGLALGEDPILVPLRGKTQVYLYGLETDRVDPPARGKKARGVLNITFWSRKLSDPSLHLRAAVEADDVLLLGEVGFRVRNVVPRDDKTKAIGWVELAPDPIPKADLVRDKVKVVEPEPADPKDDAKPKK